MDKAEQIREMEHRHEKLSYNKVSTLIYAGNNMCCQMHFEQELLSKGVKADISLELEKLDNPQGVDYFFWLPWKDNTAPSAELIDVGLGVVKHLEKLGVKMYIHCKNGHGRTTTFLACYFMDKYNFNPQQALEEVRRVRPSMHLNDIQREFLNKYRQRMANG